MTKKINLGTVSPSLAIAKINESVKDQEDVEIHFVKKNNNCFCTVSITFLNEEFMTDENGKKWKRVYE